METFINSYHRYDLKEPIIKYVLYHGDCVDGFASMYVAWLEFGNDAIYKEVNYGERFPELPLTKDDSIYILDFSYSRETLLALNDRVNTLIVIDHHEPAKEALSDLDFAIFDMTKSGATLTWEYFNKNKPVPALLRCVQDYDLYTFHLKETLPLMTAMYENARRADPRFWSQLSISMQKAFAGDHARYSENHSGVYYSFLEHGEQLVKSQQFAVDRFYLEKKYSIHEINGLHVVVLGGVGENKSLINTFCSAALKIEGVDYAVAFHFLPTGNLKISFRSKQDGVINVDKIARSFGGGGRFSTAGAVVPFPQSLHVVRHFYSGKVLF